MVRVLLWAPCTWKRLSREQEFGGGGTLSFGLMGQDSLVIPGRLFWTWVGLISHQWGWSKGRGWGEQHASAARPGAPDVALCAVRTVQGSSPSAQSAEGTIRAFGFVVSTGDQWWDQVLHLPFFFCCNQVVDVPFLLNCSLFRLWFFCLPPPYDCPNHNKNEMKPQLSSDLGFPFMARLGRGIRNHFLPKHEVLPDALIYPPHPLLP